MSTTSPVGDDTRLIEGLRRGDEGAFLELIGRYGSSLLRVAMAYTRNRAVAEEVVQETWLGVLSGIDRFEGRASLKTWLFRVLTNTASTRGGRERRTVPFSSLAGRDDENGGVDADRFLPPDHHRWPDHWAFGPTRWATPEEGLLAGETRGVILGAIERLPANQRSVIALRDIEGWSSEDVCETL